MTDNGHLKGPGAKPKDTRPRAKDQRAAVDAALQVQVEVSIAEIAAKAGASHEFVIQQLVEIAGSPWQQPGARVAALRELSEIMGTKKLPPAQHVHLHHHLARLPDDLLEARIVTLLSGSA